MEPRARLGPGWPEARSWTVCVSTPLASRPPWHVRAPRFSGRSAREKPARAGPRPSSRVSSLLCPKGVGYGGRAPGIPSLPKAAARRPPGLGDSWGCSQRRASLLFGAPLARGVALQARLQVLFLG